MKQFYEQWDDSEIESYVKTYKVLVLFGINGSAGEADINIHGELSEDQKFLLKVSIISFFGGKSLSSKLCSEINDFAIKWYRSNIKKPDSVRVLNIGGKSGRK